MSANHDNQVTTEVTNKTTNKATNKITVTVPCPECRKPVPMTASFPDRPFCSARCKSMDFGAWASESYRIESRDDEAGEQWSEDHNSSV